MTHPNHLTLTSQYKTLQVPRLRGVTQPLIRRQVSKQINTPDISVQIFRIYQKMIYSFVHLNCLFLPSGFNKARACKLAMRTDRKLGKSSRLKKKPKSVSIAHFWGSTSVKVTVRDAHSATSPSPDDGTLSRPVTPQKDKYLLRTSAPETEQVGTAGLRWTRKETSKQDHDSQLGRNVPNASVVSCRIARRRESASLVARRSPLKRDPPTSL